MQTELYLSLFVAFAAGAIPFGWIIARLWGVEDVRRVGSHNIGATNVTRTAGRLAGALTFLLDLAKGVAPTLYFQEHAAWIGFAAVLGHCFSPFLSFKGGKGVSTTLGVVLVLNPWLGGGACIAYVLGWAILKTSALGSLFAMLTALAGAVLFQSATGDKLAIISMVMLVLARHSENWDQLLKRALTLAIVASTLAMSTPLTPARAAENLVDFRGKPVATTWNPKRVAALMPNLAEAVVELGEGTRLVAAPDYSRLPSTLSGVSKLGPYNRVSAEAVYSLHPDLVLASMDGNDATLVNQLEALGARVIVVNTQSLNDIVRSLRIVAVALGRPDHPLVKNLEKAFSQPDAKPSRRVFVQLGWDPIITISRKTFVDELVRKAGGINVFADAAMKYPKVGAEEVLARNPDEILICQLTDSGDEARKASDFWNRFKDLKAVKNKQIHIVRGDILTKPGLRLLDGLEELKRIL